MLQLILEIVADLLVNGIGEMIGMNTIIWTEGAGSVGVGFAIPINTIKEYY